MPTRRSIMWISTLFYRYLNPFFKHSASTASLENVVWYVMIGTVGVFTLVATFFVGRAVTKRVKDKRKSAGY